MCYNHRTEKDDEQRKETEDRLKRMIRDRDPSSNSDDDTGGLIVFDMEEKDDSSRRKQELA